MTAIFPFIVFFAFCWTLFLSYLQYYSQKTARPINNQPLALPFVSVIIAARNEEKNIKACLHSILKNAYPKDLFEVIVIDDHSTDGTCEEVRAVEMDFPTQTIFLQKLDGKEGKKNAISAALSIARGEYRLITDADCTVPSCWITEMVQAMADHSLDAAFGTVLIHQRNSLSERWQRLEQGNLMLTSNALFNAASPIMASAANMCFHKNLDNTFIASSAANKPASGDDVFFLHSLLNDPSKHCGFIANRNAVVITKPVKGIRDFLRQRIRWAAKSKYYKNHDALFIGALVLICQAVFVATIPMAVFFPAFAVDIALLWLLKIVAEYLLHKRFMEHYLRGNTTIESLIVSLAYPFYSLFVGTAGMFITRIKWKERSVRT